MGDTPGALTDMPWYRTDDGQGALHACVRGRGRRGAPLACRAPRFETDKADIGARCGRMASKLCDAPLVDNSRQATCSMPICDRHATAGGRAVDYCPRHAALAAR